MGSLITSCIPPLSMVAGSGIGGVLPKGVLGFVKDSATVRSYSAKGTAGGTRAGAVSFSDDPAALMAGEVAAPNGVLLNEERESRAATAHRSSARRDNRS